MSNWTAASSDCSRPANNYVRVNTVDLYTPNARFTPERLGYQVLTLFGKLGYSRRRADRILATSLQAVKGPGVLNRGTGQMRDSGFAIVGALRQIRHFLGVSVQRRCTVHHHLEIDRQLPLVASKPLPGSLAVGTQALHREPEPPRVVRPHDHVTPARP